jgi:thiamine pyrophosphate-dependent acetolactate synthase large subunit-like protein
MLNLMRSEVEAGGSSGVIYGESLALALGTRFLVLGTDLSLSQSPSPSVLPPRKLTRLKELIEANLEGDLSCGAEWHSSSSNKACLRVADHSHADTTLCLDMGSFHLWMARHLYSFRARQILISNGQQTLGVALPWAIAATLVRPAEKVLWIPGDGGFLFSAMELETAVRLQSNLVHMIWIDGTYDMLAVQEEQKYGRSSGIKFGPVDPVKYAEAFGARGFMIQSPGADHLCAQAGI